MVKLKNIKTLLLTGILVSTVVVPAVAFSSNSNGYTSWSCSSCPDDSTKTSHTVAITRNTGITSGGTKQTYGISAVGNSATNRKWTRVSINGQLGPQNDQYATWVQSNTYTVGGSYYTVFEDHMTW